MFGCKGSPHCSKKEVSIVRTKRRRHPGRRKKGGGGPCRRKQAHRLLTVWTERTHMLINMT